MMMRRRRTLCRVDPMPVRARPRIGRHVPASRSDSHPVLGLLPSAGLANRLARAT